MVPAAQVTASPRMPEAQVRKHVGEAIDACIKTQHRLARLLSAPDTEAQWDRGPESTWFFAYSDRKLRKLLEIFRRVSEILQRANLKIVCDDCFSKYGEAHPFINRIKLGKLWAEGSGFERTQTLIHEACHIAGRSVVDEWRWYGEEKSQWLAAKSWMYPMRATRNADNLGYYALDVAAGKMSIYV